MPLNAGSVLFCITRRLCNSLKALLIDDIIMPYRYTLPTERLVSSTIPGGSSCQRCHVTTQETGHIYPPGASNDCLQRRPKYGRSLPSKIS